MSELFPPLQHSTEASGVSVRSSPRFWDGKGKESGSRIKPRVSIFSCSQTLWSPSYQIVYAVDFLVDLYILNHLQIHCIRLRAAGVHQLTSTTAGVAIRRGQDPSDITDRSIPSGLVGSHDPARVIFAEEEAVSKKILSRVYREDCRIDMD